MANMRDFDLELLIRETEEEGLLQAPKRMKEEIIKKSQSIPAKAACQMTKASARVELMIYSLKTAAAVAMAIFLFSLICHPTLQAAIEQDTAWAQEHSDGQERWNDVLEKVLERANRKLWQYTGGYQAVGVTKYEENSAAALRPRCTERSGAMQQATCVPLVLVTDFHGTFV